MRRRAFWRVVFPGVDEEAIEAAERGEEDGGGEQREAQAGRAGDGWNEYGGGKEQADSDFFGQAVGAARGVEDKEPGSEQGAFGKVEVDGGGIELRQQGGEERWRKVMPMRKARAVAVVKVVAGF